MTHLDPDIPPYDPATLPPHVTLADILRVWHERDRFREALERIAAIDPGNEWSSQSGIAHKALVTPIQEVS